jgi:hypothetical protein
VTGSRRLRAGRPETGPAGSIGKWPISAARPWLPPASIPDTTIPPPTPVPSVISSMTSAARPAPRTYSANAAAFPSFSISTGQFSLASASPASGVAARPRFAAVRTSSRSRLSQPATDSPTAVSARGGPVAPLPAARSRAASSPATCAMRSTACSGPAIRCSCQISPRTAPESSSRTPAILLPPRSTPATVTGGHLLPFSDC